MQAAIDRILRTFSPKAVERTEDRPAAMSRDDALSFAVNLLDNYKVQLALRVKTH